MKTLLTALTLIVFALPAFAADVTSFTFSITSSATTATANLRIKTAQGKLARESGAGEKYQTFPWDAVAPLHYYLTKSLTKTVGTDFYGAGMIRIEADQDTKVYINGNSTYMTIYAGVPETMVLR